MKKTTIILCLLTMSMIGYSQDWFRFNDYKADNERIIKDAAQTIVNINKDLKAYAEANDIIYVDYHTAMADENMGLPKALSDDGCHPNPDTYYLMEEMVVNAINQVIKP